MIALLPLCKGIPSDLINDGLFMEFFCRIRKEIQDIPHIHEIRLLTEKGMFDQAHWRNAINLYEIFYAQPFELVTPQNVYQNPKMLEGIPDDVVVLIINPRNPFLTKTILQDALIEFDDIENGILVSVVPSIDHPCYLFSIDTQKQGDVFFSESIKPAARCEFYDNSHLWTRSHKDAPAINTTTGKKIYGRQDLPGVYEMDGSFLLSRVSFLKSLSKKLFGYPLTQENSICVSDNIDYLKYKACLRKIFNDDHEVPSGCPHDS